MRWYSDYSDQRARQIAADVFAGLVAVAAIAAGIVIGGLIAGLGEIGRLAVDAGGGFRNAMQDAESALAGIPLLGEHVAAPFAAAGGAGTSMVEAGESFQQVVIAVAVLAGLAVALVPLAIIALVWLVPRLRGADRRARLRSIVGADGALDLEGYVELELRRAGVRR